MANILSTGLSGLLASQRNLATTGHNITNANTANFSRQRVELGTAPPQLQSGSYIGTGVDVVTVRRVYDDFLTRQVRGYGSSQSQLETLAGMTSQVENLLGDQGTGLSVSLQHFFGSVQAVSADPELGPARQEMIQSAEALAAGFRATHGELNTLRQNVNQGLQAAVTEINDLAEHLAALNRDIATARTTNGPPNDLLDRRDKLLADLAQRVNVQTVTQADGTLTAFIGNGHALVSGTKANQLTVTSSARDPGDLVVAYRNRADAPEIEITQQLTGGKIGGYLSFRRDVLEPTQNQLGLLAIGLAEMVNAQHQRGMDLMGELGGNLFQAGSPQVLTNSSNVGDGLITAQIQDAGSLSGSDYELSFDGTNYGLKRLTDGAMVATGSAGPFTVDGLTIELTSGTPVAGDRFLIRPTRQGAANFNAVIGDADRIAAAAPVTTAVNPGNSGAARISAGRVEDATDPNLRSAVEIRFTAPDTFDLVDAATGTILSAGQTYQDGEEIGFHGWTVVITGPAEAGDSFQILDNRDGIGDNRNALLLGELQLDKTLLNGRNDFQEVLAGAVSNAGSLGSRAHAALEIQETLLTQASQAQASVSGVNLEEEAANLMRFQQAFEASAQVIRTANAVFDTILSIAGR